MAEKSVLPTLAGIIAPMATVTTDNPKNIDNHSLFLPRFWKKTTPFVRDNQRITCNNQQGLNQEMIYELTKFGHMIDSCVLRITMPSHTVVPAGTAYYEDWLGFAMTDYFRAIFGPNLLYDINGYDLYFKHRRTQEFERANAQAELVHGDQTLVARTNALTNGIELYVDMMQYFENHESDSLPIHVLSQKLRFVHKTDPLQNFVTIPAGTTVTPNGPYQFEMILGVIHLTGHEGDMIFNMTQDEFGITYMFHQAVRQISETFGSTSNNFQVPIKMSGFTKPMKQITMALIPDRLMNQSGTQDRYFFKTNPTLGPVPPGQTPYLPPTEYNITANGQYIQRTIPWRYDTVFNHWRKLKTQHGEDIIHQFYNIYPNSVNASLGYMDYTNLNNPVLNLFFQAGGTGTDPVNPALPQQLRMIFNGEDYNFLCYRKGNVNRTFN